jgi:hypothetical protein
MYRPLSSTLLYHLPLAEGVDLPAADETVAAVELTAPIMEPITNLCLDKTKCLLLNRRLCQKEDAMSSISPEQIRFQPRQEGPSVPMSMRKWSHGDHRKV